MFVSWSRFDFHGVLYCDQPTVQMILPQREVERGATLEVHTLVARKMHTLRYGMSLYLAKAACIGRGTGAGAQLSIERRVVTQYRRHNSSVGWVLLHDETLHRET
jgi:hypothetical protein